MEFFSYEVQCTIGDRTAYNSLFFLYLYFIILHKKYVMTKIYKILVLTCILTCLIIRPGQSQNNQARFRHLNAWDGFTSATVWSIYKDSRGFMWFGSHDGLYRYDGYQFKAYKHDPEDSTSLSNNSIRRILEDKDGNLWMGSSWYGLNKYDRAKDNFKRYYPNPDTLNKAANGISDIYQDNKGTLWVTSLTGGLHEYLDSTENFRTYKYDTVNAISFHNFIRTMYEDSRGNFWLGAWNGLFMFDRNYKNYLQPYFLDNVNVIHRYNRGNETVAVDNFEKERFFLDFRFNDIYEDQTGNLWFTTAHGLLKYDTTLMQLTLFEEDENDPFAISSDYTKLIVNDPYSAEPSFWFPTDWGLNHFYPETGRSITYYHDPDDPHTTPYSNMQGIYLDDCGLLWVGIESSGVSILNLMNTHYEYFRIDPLTEGEQMHTATTFCEDSYGYLWVGTEKGGLYKYDSNMNLVEQYDLRLTDCEWSARWNFIYSMTETPDSLLWIGSINHGLFLYDRPNNEFIQCNLYVRGTQYICFRIESIFQDSFGWYWVGSINNAGLLYCKPGLVKPVEFYGINHPVLGYMDIRDFHEDNNRNLWVVSNGGGIFILRPENRESLEFEKFIPGPEFENLFLNTLSIYSDNDSILWFGGIHGLIRYSKITESVTTFNSANGMVADFIYDIEGDGKHLWISTDKGLARFDPQASGEEMVKIMRLTDGVPFEDIYTFDLYKSDDGMIYIGGKRGSGKGFYRFHPDQIMENSHIPPLVITSFEVNNSPFPLDTNITEKKHIQLKHNQNYFSFEFAALDYVNPERNKYTYKLEGVDNDWIHSGTRRFVNYTGVSPGTYTFRVKGSNNDGIWNEEGTSIVVSITPPPWKTWWAFTLYGLFIISILIIIIRFYIRRQQLIHNLEVEQIQTEKLEELDKMKSRFFANISHEFRTPLTLILGPVEKIINSVKDKTITSELSMVHRNARRLQKLINQLLSLSKLESGKLQLQAQEMDAVPLIRGYVQSFESLAKQKGIELIIKTETDSIMAWLDQDKIEAVLYNLLSNAFKYTEAGGRIEITLSNSLKIDNQQTTIDNLIIKVSNTGSGIPPEKLSHIFNRFYQADNGFSKDQEGTGIGLALTKELVELHHGNISVESEVEVGTTFTVVLPLGMEHLKDQEIVGSQQSPVSILHSPFFSRHSSVNSLQSTVFSRQSSVGSEEPLIVNRESVLSETESSIVNRQPSIGNNLQPATRNLQQQNQPILLIVEDNTDLRVYIRSYLDQSYHIIEAENGKEGLKAAISHIPDLIISDVMMPEMDGYELSKHLKTDERTSHIPLILLTARASMESKIEGLETGADDFITKPFDAQELTVRVKNLINQRRKLTEKLMKKAREKGVTNWLELSDSGINVMDQKFMQKALKVVEENLADPEFKIDHFSKAMALSHSQLYRKIHALTDQSPNKFIRSTRLQKAAEMIARHEANIAEIAYDVGFNNPSYFAACFKKQFGKLPSEYLQ